MDAIISFIESIKTTMMTITGSVAVIGLLGLAAMYLLSPIPVFADWKANNPKAFSTVVTGLLIAIFAGSGGVAVLLGF